MVHIQIFQALIKSCALFVAATVVCLPSRICSKVHWSAETVCMDKVQPAWLQKLGLIWSCGCYLHETFRTAPLTMKWLEEGRRGGGWGWQNLNDSLLSSYFCTCFPGWLVYIFIREFSTLLKDFGVFQDVCEKWKVCHGRQREKKNPNRFHVCVVVIKCRPVSGCSASLYFIQEGLQYDFQRYSKILQMHFDKTVTQSIFLFAFASGEISWWHNAMSPQLPFL